jgi:hypothetical protein
VASIRLEGFSIAEVAMIKDALEALRLAGYDTARFEVLIRADLAAGYRGMSWPEGAVLGEAAFASPTILTHVLEEELLHLLQKTQGRATGFGPCTARSLEEEVNAQRKFPLPEK